MATFPCSSLPPEAVRAEWDGMEPGSRATVTVKNSDARDAVFEQLLRLAFSYASSQAAARQGANGSKLRRSPLTEDIEVRAYHLYLDRGAAHGRDVDDWLQAERQVLDGLKKDKATLRVALAFGLPNSAPGVPNSALPNSAHGLPNSER